MRCPGTLALVALALAGCGGSRETKDEEEVSEALAGLGEELGKLRGARRARGGGTTASGRVPAGDRLLEAARPVRGDPVRRPPEGGIPAIDVPRFTSAGEVDWLGDREPVVAVTVGGETRAYPIQILLWHEIVNDELGGKPVAVTFCPLCNTAIVFDRRLDGDVLSFGTTGTLRESDLVMYDRRTESWWKQFSGEAIVGELAGKKLEQLPVRIVPWEDLRKASPTGLVLSPDTGFTRDYGRNPYVGYDSVDSPPIFSVTNEDDDRLPPKERVVYVEVGDRALAVPFPTLAEKRIVTAETATGDLVVRWSPGLASALDGGDVATGRDVGAAVVTLDEEPIPFTEQFWFAVAAFRPDLEIVAG